MNVTNTLFLIISSILVLFMTTGLAFFYGGLVSQKNVVNTMLSVFVMTGIAIILWISVGYSLSFEGNIYGIIGNLHNFFMNNIRMGSLNDQKIPTMVFSGFEMTFAIITPALFVGSIVGRIKFNFLLSFLILWSVLIYYPMVHLVWSSQGLLAGLGILDFAGGTVVHINAGITGLILSAVLGKRIKPSNTHYSLPWVLIGTVILWIGWYGFNSGSALGISNIAVQAATTTTVSTGSAMVTWMILDMIISGKPNLVGVCTGTLCGLVGITPACGFVTIAGSFWIGIFSTLSSYIFIHYFKDKIGIDDTLDVFGCHGISGITGSILVGLFATKYVNPIISHNGLFYGGGWYQVGIQALTTVITIIFVSAMTFIIIKVLCLFIPMRVEPKEEKIGLDKSEQDEEADYTVNISNQLANSHSYVSMHKPDQRDR